MKSTLILIFLVTLIFPLAIATEITGNLSTNPNVYQVAQCVESWTCSAWSACSGGTQTRTCTDSNACGTVSNKPAASQSCTEPTSPPSGGGGGGGGSRSTTTIIITPGEEAAPSGEIKEVIAGELQEEAKEVVKEETKEEEKSYLWLIPIIIALIALIIFLIVYYLKTKKK